MMRIYFLPLLLVPLLNGCGQTGSLYLEDDTPTAIESKTNSDNPKSKTE